MDYPKGPSQGQPGPLPQRPQASRKDPRLATTEDPSQESTDQRTPTDSPVTHPSPASSATQKASTPRGQHEHDSLMLARLSQSRALSTGMLKWMSLFLKMREAEVEGSSLTPAEAAAIEAARKTIMELPAITRSVLEKRTSASPAETTPKPVKPDERKRQRSRSLSLTPPEGKRRPGSPLPTQIPRPLQTPKRRETASDKMAPQATQAPRATYHRDCARATDPPASFAKITAGGARPSAAPIRPAAGRPAQTAPANRSADASASRPTRDGATGPQQGRPSTTSSQIAATEDESSSVIVNKPPPKPRYPPIVVEKINNWTSHFRAIAEKLGKTPNGRPYGQGVRFSPEDETEYRVIQAYLYDLEKTEQISWFAYSLPADKSLKVAIRGLPADTDPEEIKTALQEKGYEPEYIKNIMGREGRPGSIFFAQFKKTPDLTPGIYAVDELLFMPGIVIEAWRAKRGPAQCHRCQLFRHSSHNCHRTQACVKCGEPHFAKDCPRPREEPATCANCGGAHPANYGACPVFKKEARNKKAGTIAITATGRKGAALTEQRTVEETAPATLMAPANPPGQTATKRRRKKTSKKPDSEEAPQTKAQGAPKRDSLSDTIGALKDILEAVQSGMDAETAALRGLMKILQNKNGQQ